MSKNISRRSLMKGAAAASLAVAASSLLTGCSIPTLGDLFGPKTQSFTVGDFTFKMTLEGCRFVPHYNQIAASFEVNNQLSEVDVLYDETNTRMDPNAQYQIRPTFSYTNSEDSIPAVNSSYATSTIPSGPNQTVVLLGQLTEEPGRKTHIELTLELYKDGVLVDGVEPITFKLI